MRRDTVLVACAVAKDLLQPNISIRSKLLHTKVKKR
jgi:hypothetical protein